MLRAAARLRPGVGTGAGRGIRGRGSGPGDRPPPDTRVPPDLLACLVCPLSRRRLRYEESTNQLINDELGIAYPIVDGIPNMIPQEARLIRKGEDGSKEEGSSQQ